MDPTMDKTAKPRSGDLASVDSGVGQKGTALSLARAPALHVLGRTSERESDPYRFRLPYPPMPAAGLRAAHALERRAKKAYFATLDSLRTGAVDSARQAQLARLALEARARETHDALGHLLRVMDAVSRLAFPQPLLRLPPVPFREVVVTLRSGPLARQMPGLAASAACLEWPLEWLRTRGHILTQGLEISVAADRA